MSNASPATVKDSVLMRWCYAICFLQVLAWTLLPTLLRHALPMDALEGAVWGQHLQLGYDRNPWLNAWLTRLAIDLGGTSGWVVYLFSQLCVMMAVYAIYQLGKAILQSRAQAIIAALMLLAIQYYTIAAFDFNDNVLELGLWPLMSLFFYRSLTRDRLQDWLLLAVTAGLALMAKYYTAILLLVMLFFMLIDVDARKKFSSKGFYYSLLLFLIIVLPHFVWLCFHDFVTITYADNRVDTTHIFSFWTYLKPVLKFGGTQLLTFLSGFFVFCFALGKRNQARRKATFNRRFLWIVGTGTFVVTLVLGFCTGWDLHALWGTPLLSPWALLIVYYFNPQVSAPAFFREVTFIQGLTTVLASINTAGLCTAFV